MQPFKQELKERVDKLSTSLFQELENPSIDFEDQELNRDTYYKVMGKIYKELRDMVKDIDKNLINK